jgi:hypothetical protein
VRKERRRTNPENQRKKTQKKKEQKKTEQHAESKEEKGQHTHKQGLSLPLFYPCNKKNKRRINN